MKPDLKAIFKQIEKVQEELEKVQAEL